MSVGPMLLDKALWCLSASSIGGSTDADPACLFIYIQSSLLPL